MRPAPLDLAAAFWIVREQAVVNLKKPLFGASERAPSLLPLHRSQLDSKLLLALLTEIGEKPNTNMSMKLYVGNLAFQTSSEDLQELFSQAGTVESASVVEDRETGRSRGFGFVEMATKEEGEAAIAQFNGKEHNGRDLNVNEATPARRSWWSRRRRRRTRRLRRRRRWSWRRRSRRQLALLSRQLRLAKVIQESLRRVTNAGGFYFRQSCAPDSALQTSDSLLFRPNSPLSGLGGTSFTTCTLPAAEKNIHPLPARTLRPVRPRLRLARRRCAETSASRLLNSRKRFSR